MTIQAMQAKMNGTKLVRDLESLCRACEQKGVFKDARTGKLKAEDVNVVKRDLACLTQLSCMLERMKAV